MNLQELDLASLTTAERLLLMDRLLEDVFCEAIDEPFTPEQLQMIDERVKEIDEGRVSPIPWKDAYQRLLQHFQ